MAQPLRLYRQSIQCPCHDAEAPVSALRRFVAEHFVKIQQLIKSSPAHHIHDPFVVFRTFYRQPVRPVFPEFMGEISAADNHCTSVKRIGSLRNQLPQADMICQRKAGQTDSHQLITCIVLIDVIERNYRPMIKFRIPYSQRPCREPRRGSGISQIFDKSTVITDFNLHLRCTELPHISSGASAR